MIITKIKLWAILGLFILASFLLLSIHASPDLGLAYSLKRFQENKFMQMKSSPEQKADYMSGLLDERLAELKYLVENRRIGYILSSSLRYSTTVGNLTNLIKENNLSDKIPAVQVQFKEHEKTVEGLVAICQKNDNTECKYIRDDANYLKIYSSQLQ